MNSPVSDFDHRLAAIERQCRQWKYLGLVGLILSVLVAIPAGAVFVTDFLFARGLVLTDAASRFVVFDAVSDTGSAFKAFLNPASGRVQAIWSTTPQGNTIFSQHDVLGRFRYATLMNPDGSAASGMIDPSGHFRAVVLQDPSGNAVYAVFNAGGQVIGTLP